jgi:N-acetylglucosamine kinase-like BadF-type ATPase
MDKPKNGASRTGDLLLAVDGGHTTQAVIASADGEILGRGLGPPCNHHRVGIEKARRALETAVQGAFAQFESQKSGPRSAGDAAPSWVHSARIGAACFGLSGIDGPQDEALFRGWLTERGCPFKFTIGNDSELVLGGGTPEGWGIALLSGTGSICLGRTPNGRALRVGGWGHVLGDEGSGYQIATDALKLATQAADGRGGSPAMLQAALAFWKLTDPYALIGVVCRPDTTPEDIAGFAGRVVDLAGRNEPSAREILDHSARALAAHIDTVIEKLSLKAPPLALGGSMMRVTLKRAVLDNVKSPLGPVAVVNDPLQGAITTARRLLRTANAA